MRDLTNGKVTNDNEVVFYDGFLYIISVTKEPYVENYELHDAEYAIDVKCMNAGYDEPVSLAQIAEKYPNVRKVIFDDAMRGYVYNYGNHSHDKEEKNVEMWELVGTTIGYA